MGMKLILLGPPGSGKGTVSESLCREFNLLHVSAGELLRAEVEKKSNIGSQVKDIMEAGDNVPDDIVIELMKAAVKGKKQYIFDGFPRTIYQAKRIVDLAIPLAVYLDVPEKVVVERFSGRRMCEKNNHGFHIKFIPPKKKGICDYDGSKLLKRKDDNPKVIKERIAVYHTRTTRVIEYLKKKGIIKTVNGSQSPEKVYADVKKVVEKFFR
jgi:adenylate kinase